MTYELALQRFAALWAEARALGVDARDDWLADLEPDLAVARALNGQLLELRRQAERGPS